MDGSGFQETHGSRVRLAVMTVLALASLAALAYELPRLLRDHGLWDYGAFVASGRAAANGLDPYGVYPPLTPHVVFPGFESWNPNLNPPISALLFQVFDLADPAFTRRIWNGISLCCYLAAIGLLLTRYAKGLERVALGLWAIGLAGFLDTLYLGQIYTPLVLAGVGAWLLLERGHGLTAGILIGLVISMKPNFLVWPVLLFLAGHRLPSLVAFSTAAVIAAVPLAVFGPHIYIDWLKLVATDGARSIFLTNASLAGLAARLGASWLGPILSGLLLICLAAWAYRQRPKPLDVTAFALLAALLASPLGWIHYTLFLLPVLMHHRDRLWAQIAALALVIPVPLVLTQFGKPALMQFTIGSVYGWALALMLVGLTLREWRRPLTVSGERSASLSYLQPDRNGH